MYFFSLVGALLFSLMGMLHAQIGYFCVPVADLIAKPFEAKNKNEVAALYDALSISPEIGKTSCLRVHQGIFNERVSILGYKNHQVYVELLNCFAQPLLGGDLQSVKVWTQAAWVVSENELSELEIERSVFPQPIDYARPLCCDQRSITLLVPWYDSVTEMTYSAGTRFVVLDSLSSMKEYAILLYDAHKKYMTASVVPKEYTVFLDFETEHEQRMAFVELLYLWCSLQGDIPYVWGGTSFIYLCQEDEYATLEENYNRGVLSAYWNRPTQRPYAGFDASGLIMRAAQIVGAPFFCVNSATIAHNLRILQPGESLEEGDLIWSPGYVGVVGSIEKNELIEAQGYARGYGKIHVLSLNKRFADISSWDDFLYCYGYGLPLQSLNSEGRIISSVPKFIIFKFPTCMVL